MGGVVNQAHSGLLPASHTMELQRLTQDGQTSDIARRSTQARNRFVAHALYVLLGLHRMAHVPGG